MALIEIGKAMVKNKKSNINFIELNSFLIWVIILSLESVNVELN